MLRLRMERLVAGRSRGRTELLPPPAHLSLGDSRTFNLAVDPPEPVGGARLLLSRGGARHQVPLVVERTAPGGGRLLTATATLRGPGAEPDAAGLHLTSGVWRLTVETTGPEGRVRRRGLPLEDTASARRYAPDFRTGALIRLVRCPGGRAALQVDEAGPQAELVRFEPRGDGVTLRGRLLAAPPTARRAEAVRHADDTVVPLEVAWEGREFSLDLPLGELAGSAATGPWTWGFRLVPAPARHEPEAPDRLVLARRLSGPRSPRAVFRHPARLCALPCGSLVRVQPYFTASGAFALTCLDLSN
ncbi:hypothetical protein [Streptomyces sp. Da 82-17]|uniref:hypothetical protein n=1 Tax=Streptomyces sp. Da 82-17 TaxID=3377116 RepID=UPI0038D3DE70